MAKRHAQVTAAADADASPPPEPARAPDGRFVGNRGLNGPPEPTVREWKNDDQPFDARRFEAEQLLTKPEGEAPPAEGADDKPPADVEPNPDPDGSPPDEQPSPAAAKEETPPAERQITTTYLNKQQRDELARKLEEGKRERQKDAELKRIQDEKTALEAKLKSPRLRERIEALGTTPEQLLEDLLLGKGDADDKAVAAEAGITPEVAELRKQVADLQNERKAEREAAARQAQEQTVRGAVTKLQQVVTRDQGYHMIAALKQHGALYQEIEKVYDGVSDIGHVTQVVADRVEEDLRRMYPEVAAVLAAGGTPAQAAAAVGKDPPVAPGKKAAVGARGGATRAESTDDLPLEMSERHMAIKDRFFPGWKR